MIRRNTKLLATGALVVGLSASLSVHADHRKENDEWLQLTAAVLGVSYTPDHRDRYRYRDHGYYHGKMDRKAYKRWRAQQIKRQKRLQRRQTQRRLHAHDHRVRQHHYDGKRSRHDISRKNLHRGRHVSDRRHERKHERRHERKHERVVERKRERVVERKRERDYHVKDQPKHERVDDRGNDRRRGNAGSSPTVMLHKH